MAWFGVSLFGCFTQIPDKPNCGDGLIQITEDCDDKNDINGDGCDANCTVTACGNRVLSEGEVCEDGNTSDGDGCAADCSRLEGCGNGTLDANEICDDANEVSGDGCRSDCLKEEVCGDGVVDANEVCDDGNTSDGDGCAGDCSFVEGCGDGVINGAEVCDDGNTVSGDGCNSACNNIEICGDADTDAGEECDDGNDLPNDGCNPDCRLELPAFTEIEPNDDFPEANGIFSGDVVISADVTHDSGNGRDSDFFQIELYSTSDLKLSLLPISLASCSNRLRMALLRADGSVVNEVSNNNGNTQCPLLDNTIDKQPAGIYFIRVREENGGNAATDLIYELSITFQSLCGDSLVESNEVCDDDNTTNGDGCRGDCRGVEVCGDGVLDGFTGEECDDDDTSSGDGCSSSCQDEVGFFCFGEPSLCNAICGDGLVVGGEQCDDDNNTSGDGCNAQCRDEFCGDGVDNDGDAEACDGGDLNGETCATINPALPNGTLSCSAACGFDASACTL